MINLANQLTTWSQKLPIKKSVWNKNCLKILYHNALCRYKSYHTGPTHTTHIQVWRPPAAKWLPYDSGMLWPLAITKSDHLVATFLLHSCYNMMNCTFTNCEYRNFPGDLIDVHHIDNTNGLKHSIRYSVLV